MQSLTQSIYSLADAVADASGIVVSAEVDDLDYIIQKMMRPIPDCTGEPQ
ncbi:hypothetical protein ACFSKU_16445 [Pontibacter silvestris]|uniref:Uncharacterized protein n=1 Tax=Pontibacter silvestris TaxID=2305183 RepID=A0ABW4X1L7_9BACT|nr:hypothetical protein [Pontibacter silvestris]MCC9136062.1 hypothetical protein [Pontibacter silvestris]